MDEAARELQMAAQLTRAAELRVLDYREGTVTGAERAVFGLEIVQVASTAYVSAGTGGLMGVLVGAGLTGAQRSAREGAAVYLDLQQKVDWSGIAFDTVFAAVTGRFAGRLGSAIATRLAVRIGSRLAAQVVTAVVVGRAAGVVQAVTQVLFNAGRGRTSITLDQFINQIADQLTVHAAFLDLVGYGFGATAEHQPAGEEVSSSHEEAPHRAEATTGDSELDAIIETAVDQARTSGQALLPHLDMHPSTATLPDQVNIDEMQAVGEPRVPTAERYRRAVDAKNHQILDAFTNQRTKGTRTEQSSPARSDAPRDPVSLGDDPGAMFARPFSEVIEMAQLWDEAVATVQARPRAAKYSPAALQDRVNAKMRQLMSRGTSPAARRVQTALDRNGYDPRTLRVRR